MDSVEKHKSDATRLNGAVHSYILYADPVAQMSAEGCVIDALELPSPLAKSCLMTDGTTMPEGTSSPAVAAFLLSSSA